MRCADGPVAAGQIIGGAIFVAAPADAIGMLRFERYASHDLTIQHSQPAATGDASFRAAGNRMLFSR